MEISQSFALAHIKSLNPGCGKQHGKSAQEVKRKVFWRWFSINGNPITNNGITSPLQITHFKQYVSRETASYKHSLIIIWGFCMTDPWSEFPFCGVSHKTILDCPCLIAVVKPVCSLVYFWIFGACLYWGMLFYLIGMVASLCSSFDPGQ